MRTALSAYWRRPAAAGSVRADVRAGRARERPTAVRERRLARASPPCHRDRPAASPELQRVPVRRIRPAEHSAPPRSPRRRQRLRPPGAQRRRHVSRAPGSGRRAEAPARSKPPPGGGPPRRPAARGPPPPGGPPPVPPARRARPRPPVVRPRRRWRTKARPGDHAPGRLLRAGSPAGRRVRAAGRRPPIRRDRDVAAAVSARTARVTSLSPGWRPAPGPARHAAARAPARSTPAATAAHQSRPAPSSPRLAAPAGPPAHQTAANCYEPGEFCRTATTARSAWPGRKVITCEDNDGWRWEPQ